MFFHVFSTFEYQVGPESFWNHQKWISREIPRRHRSAGILWSLFESKNLEKSRKNPKIPSGGADLHREVHTTPPGSRKISKKWEKKQDPRKSRQKIKISKIASVKFLKATSSLGIQILVRSRPAGAAEKTRTKKSRYFSGQARIFGSALGEPLCKPMDLGGPGRKSRSKNCYSFFLRQPLGGIGPKLVILGC